MVTWEFLILDGEEGKKGCFAKIRSWLNDEEVFLPVEENALQHMVKQRQWTNTWIRSALPQQRMIAFKLDLA